MQNGFYSILEIFTMKIFYIIIFCFGLFFPKAQEFKAFQFYNKEGKPVNSKKLINALSKYDVVLFGEFHNNSINHWLQLQVSKALFEKKTKNVVLGAEMFERDNQQQLNAYLEGNIEDKNLKDSVRLWNNFKTDYQPLLDFAKSNQIPFIATNIPRRYASQTSKLGIKSLDTLSDSDKKWIATLPIQVSLKTPGYTEMKSLMGSHVDDLKLMNFISAQAVKDATMAESIAQNWQSGKTFLHFNGDYHSKMYGGIYWYLKQIHPNLKIAVISVFEAEDPNLSLPIKDFVSTEFNLVFPSDITKTY